MIRKVLNTLALRHVISIVFENVRTIDITDL